MIVKRVDWQLRVIEQRSEKPEFFETTDEQGRKIKYIVVEKLIFPDGTVIERSKSMPIGTAKLECGHFTPIFNYDQAKAKKLLCRRCKGIKKVVDVKLR